MQAETVRFVKHRDVPRRQMWYVTCDADGGSRGNEHWRWTVETSLDEQGQWVANGVSGGSGPVPRCGRPWADLGGNWGPAGFRAGGTVEDAGTGIARVRLTERRRPLLRGRRRERGRPVFLGPSRRDADAPRAHRPRGQRGGDGRVGIRRRVRTSALLTVLRLGRYARRVFRLHPSPGQLSSMNHSGRQDSVKWPHHHHHRGSCCQLPIVASLFGYRHLIRAVNLASGVRNSNS